MRTSVPSATTTVESPGTSNRARLSGGRGDVDARLDQRRRGVEGERIPDQGVVLVLRERVVDELPDVDRHRIATRAVHDRQRHVVEVRAAEELAVRNPEAVRLLAGHEHDADRIREAERLVARAAAGRCRRHVAQQTLAEHGLDVLEALPIGIEEDEPGVPDLAPARVGVRRTAVGRIRHGAEPPRAAFVEEVEAARVELVRRCSSRRSDPPRSSSRPMAFSASQMPPPI